MYKRFKWCISDRRSVSDRLKARGYPCAKGYNSSASQWLSGEQVRLCSGHPKVHFGTIVEGSWGWRGGGGGCTVGPPGSLTILLALTEQTRTASSRRETSEPTDLLIPKSQPDCLQLGPPDFLWLFTSDCRLRPIFLLSMNLPLQYGRPGLRRLRNNYQTQWWWFWSSAGGLAPPTRQHGTWLTVATSEILKPRWRPCSTRVSDVCRRWMSLPCIVYLGVYCYGNVLVPSLSLPPFIVLMFLIMLMFLLSLSFSLSPSLSLSLSLFLSHSPPPSLPSIYV